MTEARLTDTPAARARRSTAPPEDTPCANTGRSEQAESITATMSSISGCKAYGLPAAAVPVIGHRPEPLSGELLRQFRPRAPIVERTADDHDERALPLTSYAMVPSAELAFSMKPPEQSCSHPRLGDQAGRQTHRATATEPRPPTLITAKWLHKRGGPAGSEWRPRRRWRWGHASVPRDLGHVRGWPHIGRSWLILGAGRNIRDDVS